MYYIFASILSGLLRRIKICCYFEKITADPRSRMESKNPSRFNLNPQSSTSSHFALSFSDQLLFASLLSPPRLSLPSGGTTSFLPFSLPHQLFIFVSLLYPLLPMSTTPSHQETLAAIKSYPFLYPFMLQPVKRRNIWR